MMTALWTAATGLDAQQRNVDVTANNLANVNTAGFKRSRADFQDLFYSRFKEPGAQSATSGLFIPAGIQVGHGVANVATTLLFQQGTPQNTGRSLDVFIQDQTSMFQVQLPNGQIAYTRDGSFNRDAAGNIVTVAGYQLVPPMTVPAEAIDVSINPNGIVEAVFTNQPNQQLGQIQLAFFNNPGGLRQTGGNLYVQTDSSGPPTLGNPGDNQFGVLQSGFLELSNVNAAEELINLIKAQRAFDMNSRTIQTSDEMLQTTAALRR